MSEGVPNIKLSGIPFQAPSSESADNDQNSERFVVSIRGTILQYSFFSGLCISIKINLGNVTAINLNKSCIIYRMNQCKLIAPGIVSKWLMVIYIIHALHKL